MNKSKLPTIIAAACVAFAALIVGCGGGGGGTSTTSTNATNGTNDTTAGANLPPDAIIFGIADNDGTTFDVNYIASDGSGPTNLLSNVSAKILLFAVNPQVENEYIVAADVAGNGTFGIYRTVGLNLSSAIELVAPAFSYIGSLSVTNDGNRVVYTGLDESGASFLYEVSVDGGTSEKLVAADAAAVSPADNDTVAYVAPPEGGGDLNQVFTRSLAAGSGGAAQTITTKAVNHVLPVFSRDGKSIAWWEESDLGSFPIVYNRSAATTTELPNPTQLYPQGSVFNSGGTKLATAAADGAGIGKLLTQSLNGTSPVIIYAAPALLGNYGIYWTNSQGRLAGGNLTGMSTVGRRFRRR